MGYTTVHTIKFLALHEVLGTIACSTRYAYALPGMLGFLLLNNMQLLIA